MVTRCPSRKVPPAFQSAAEPGGHSGQSVARVVMEVEIAHLESGAKAYKCIRTPAPIPDNLG
jgi:hypothetical protein